MKLWEVSLSHKVLIFNIQSTLLNTDYLNIFVHLVSVMRSRGLNFLFCFAMKVKQRQFDQVTLEQKPRGREGVNFENTREMSIPFRRNSRCED